MGEGGREGEESEAQTVLVQETPGELKANSSIITGVSWWHTTSSRAAGARPANPRGVKSPDLTDGKVICDCAPHQR